MTTKHFKHPVMGFSCCGHGDAPDALLTDAIAEVDCSACKRTVPYRKRCEHRWIGNGQQNGKERERCAICGKTRTIDGQPKGRPRKWENSNDRFRRKNRK